MGHGEIDLEGFLSPMDLLVTQVNEVSLLSRLNMKKTIGELLRELKGR